MENFSPNYAEFAYTQKSEGAVLLRRVLMVVFYFAYIVGFFIFATTSKLLALFAIGPLTLYIIVLCTWRLVVYDLYVEFSKGTLHLGRIKVSKNGYSFCSPFVFLWCLIHRNESYSPQGVGTPST